MSSKTKLILSVIIAVCLTIALGLFAFCVNYKVFNNLKVDLNQCPNCGYIMNIE